MKKKIFPAFLVFGLVGAFYWLGFFHRHNFITALIDKWTGQYTVVYHGEPGLNDSELSKLANEHGFNYKRIAGCNVTEPLLNGARHYNYVMKDVLSEKHGKKFMEKF